MHSKKSQELLDKHRAGRSSPDEKALLNGWYNELSASQPPAELPADLIIKQKRALRYIKHAINQRVIRLWPRVGIAAAILIAVVDRNSVNPGFPNYRLGKPVTGMMLVKYAGVNPQTGNYSFINAKGVQADFTALDLNVTDKTEFIDLAPKYYGGLGNTFSYKGFSAGFFFTFTNRMARTRASYQIGVSGAFNVNPTVSALRRWQKPGDITDQPKVSQGFLTSYLSQFAFSQSTGGYTRATYARLSNVNINYDFRGKWLEKAGHHHLFV
jgi:hypothetical protein